jgi:hypothetical protein
MSAQGYPEGHRPQQSYSLSQEEVGQGVSGEVQDYAEVAQWNTQMYPAGLYEVQSGAGASSESDPVRCGGWG